MDEQTAWSSPWQDIARELTDFGVTEAYGLPDDDMRSHACLTAGGIDVILVRDQRNAVYGACGQAVASASNLGTVVSGRGPGTAALVPALLEASSQGSPVLVLVQAFNPGVDGELLFQWCNQKSILQPTAKEVIHWTPGCLAAAAATARTPPLGPVVVLVPDAGNETGDTTKFEKNPPAVESSANGRMHRPVLLVGGGCRDSRQHVLEMVQTLDCPVLATASGRGILDESTPQYFGLSGLYCSPEARELWNECDGVIALGTALEETAVEFIPSTLKIHQVALADDKLTWPGRTIVKHQCRVDAWRPDKYVELDPRWPAEWKQIRSRVVEWALEVSQNTRIPAILDRIVKLMQPGCAATFENGATDMWTYIWPLVDLPRDCTCLTLSEQTTLGASIPAATAMARSGRYNGVWSFCGDSAMTRFLDEEEMLNQPGVVYVIFDDGGFGWLAEQAKMSGLNADRYADGVPRQWCNSRGVPLAGVVVESPDDVDFYAERIRFLSRRTSVVVQIPVSSKDRSPMALGTW